MAQHRRLETDQDFAEALERGVKVRVFKDDQIAEQGGQLLRYSDTSIVLQSSVSDITYHDRGQCEFFELKVKR